MVKISAQFDVVYWRYCPQTHPLPHPPPKKRVRNGVLNQKTLLFLLRKIETNKYPEVETWHRWMVLLLGYVRIPGSPLMQSQR